MNPPSGPPPRLSIVIVTFRSRDEIGPCLASLPRALGGGEVEVIVVDNAPDDGTGAVVRRDFPWVRYLAPGGNLGFGRANNAGFAASAGGLVLFLNPDTVANAAALEHCARRLEAEPDLGLISPRLVRADGAMDPACRRSIPTLWDGFCRATGLAAAFPGRRAFAGYNLTYLPADGTYDVGAVNGAFMMARREVLARIAEPGSSARERAEPAGRAGDHPGESPAESSAAAAPASGAKGAGVQVFDERFFMYGDDLDLCIRVARAGLRIVYDGRVQIVHLKGVSVAKDYDRMARAIFDANRDVYLKHFNPRGSALVRWKYRAAFGLWKAAALAGARWRGRREVRPG